MPHSGGEVGGGRLFENLLVVALDRAIALEEVDDIAVLVACNLNLKMAGALHQLFDQQGGVAKGGLRLAPRQIQRGGQLGLRGNDTHTAPATAR